MIKLLFSGDFAPLVPPDMISENHFQGIEPILDSVDVHITNLECPFTLSNDAFDKPGALFKANPIAIRLLKQARVNVACMANNHILDYHEKGILDTLDICTQNGIDCLGLVSLPDGRKHWLVKEVNGKRIGFLNYCEHEFSVREPGLLGACGYDAVDAFYHIKELRPQVDYLILIYHGGNEFYPLPNPQVKKDFHYLADLGADAVIGHHTHVYSGYEIYKGKPLVYSLGNFFFPSSDGPEEWHRSIVCKMEISETIKFQLIPVTQCKDGFSVSQQSKGKGENIKKHIEELSAILIDDVKLEGEWQKFALIKGKNLTSFFMYSNRIERKLSKFNLFKKYYDRSNRQKILFNSVRCASTKKMLIDNLKP